MSENTTENIDTTANAGDNTEVSTYKAPATQEELDAIVQKRLAKERAKYSDYEELKSAAEKLRDIEDANKSELEKATERATALEAELAQTKFIALKNGIANEYGITADDASLFLTASGEEGLRKQAEALAARSVKVDDDVPPKVGNHIPNLANRQTSTGTSKEDFARSFFGL